MSIRPLIIDALCSAGAEQGWAEDTAALLEEDRSLWFTWSAAAWGERIADNDAYVRALSALHPAKAYVAIVSNERAKIRANPPTDLWVWRRKTYDMAERLSNWPPPSACL